MAVLNQGGEWQDAFSDTEDATRRHSSSASSVFTRTGPTLTPFSEISFEIASDVYTEVSLLEDSVADSADDPTVTAALEWWGKGAEQIILKYGLREIKLAYRFSIYGDESVLATILRKRWSFILNDFFVDLQAGDRERAKQLNKDQKIEGILVRMAFEFLHFLPPSGT